MVVCPQTGMNDFGISGGPGTDENVVNVNLGKVVMVRTRPLLDFSQSKKHTHHFNEELV